MDKKVVLIDISGTLHIGKTATDGAVEALNRLKQSGEYVVKLVTNTTKESRKYLFTNLKQLGFDIAEEEIVSSLWVARSYLEKNRLKPFLLVDDKAIADFEGLEFEGEPDAVVIGLAPEKFTRENMNKAFRYLMRGAKLIAIHEARYYMTESGLSLGPGLFVKALEYAAKLSDSTIVVGKPSPDFFKLALGSTHLPSACIMIGDDVEQDVAGAQNAGIRGCLVRTGKYRPGDEQRINPPPAMLVDNFSEAVNTLLAAS